jgi:pyruvate dehydrogenase (quinone)
MAKRIADEFAEVLAAAGVKRVYGIVGDSLKGLTDALRRRAKIEWVHVRHEEVAAFAAGAPAIEDPSIGAACDLVRVPHRN